MTKLFRATITKKRRDIDGVHLNNEVEHYEAEFRAQVLSQIYSRYGVVQDVLIEEIDGSNCKASTIHEVGKSQGEITTNGNEA